MASANGRTPTEAPPHASGERFRCRVDIEDVVISVEGDAAASTVGLFWEELRVACKFDGITQRTRWVTVPSAMDEAKKEALASGAAPRGLLELPYTAFNNLSFEVEFTAADADATAAGEAPAGSVAVRTVKPKRFHVMEFEVEAQNKHRMYSASGGQTGDRAPTSGNMEAISASLNKSAAKVSAWTRSVFSKLGSSGGSSSGGGGAGSVAHHHRSPSKLQNEAALATLGSHTGAPATPPPPTAAAAGDLSLHEGVYTTVVRHIDASEAYNAAGGRQRFCLVLKPESRKLPENGTGTPITIAFTLVAHYGQTKNVPRSFHNFAIVADQFVLDFSDAAAEVPSDPRDEQSQPRPIVGYAFGYTANTATSSSALEAASRAVPVAATVPANSPEGAALVRVIDFDRLHATSDERRRTREDYKALPTTCCIVSGSAGNKSENQRRIGSRVVCVARFKTSPDGLCKPSFKCQLVVSLARYYGAHGECIREAAPPIDLAELLNQEGLPQRIRTVKFSLGEMMYIRLRRFCFAEPERLRAPLLMPYDYDNSGVDIAAPPPPPQSRDAAPRAAPLPPLAEEAKTPAAAPDSPSVEDSSDSSDSAPPSPHVQRSDSDGPIAAVQEPTNPFFTLEPQAQSSADFGTAGGHDAAPVAHGAAAATTSRSAAGMWGGGFETTPAVEVTPTESNPFFTLQPRAASDASVGPAAPRDAGPSAEAERNPYDFGSPEAEDERGAARATPAFELTPF